MKRKNTEVSNDEFKEDNVQEIQKNACGKHNNKKSNSDEFKIKGKHKHGHKYNYNNVDYINANTKVKIICNDCDYNFEQIPNNHLKGSGCPQCGGTLQLTTEEFKRKGKEKHGGKYNYNSVIYTNMRTKVKITCNDCNYNFEQTPNSHLNGSGCPQCGDTLQLTIEEFKKKGKEKHGEKYDYNNSNYKNSKTKVKITCNDCNYNFEQTPDSHLRGSGCPQCSGNLKLTIEEFKKRGTEKHGKKYNYSNVIIINNSTKVKITCYDCNYNFEQTPDSHLSGHGCSKCDGNLKLTIEEFKKRGTEKHGKKYNYDYVIYINCLKKVKIMCNDCNYNFEQTPNSHLSGHGCPKCAGFLKLTTEEFKKRGKEKHHGKFNYNNVIIVNSKIKVKILCNDCNNKFEQTPNSHLCGHGCPNCIIYKGEEEIQKVLQKLLINFEKHKRLEMGNSNLELDFYFQTNLIQNIGIERDGQQHFYPVSFGCKDEIKVQENFEGVQRRDKIKNEWCKENNYHLLRISFMTPLKEYENLIIEFLQESEQHKGQPFIKCDKFYEQLLVSDYNSDDDIFVN